MFEEKKVLNTVQTMHIAMDIAHPFTSVIVIYIDLILLWMLLYEWDVYNIFQLSFCLPWSKLLIKVFSFYKIHNIGKIGTAARESNWSPWNSWGTHLRNCSTIRIAIEHEFWRRRKTNLGRILIVFDVKNVRHVQEDCGRNLNFRNCRRTRFSSSTNIYWAGRDGSAGRRSWWCGLKKFTFGGSCSKNKNFCLLDQSGRRKAWIWTLIGRDL